MTKKVFKIACPARLRPMRILRQTEEASGKDGDVQLMTVVELGFDVTDAKKTNESFADAVEALWPGSDAAMDAVWSRAGDIDGFDLVARMKLPELTLKVLTAEDGDILFSLSTAVVKSRVKLLVNNEGEPCLQLRRVAGRFDREALMRLTTFVESDIFLVAEPSQIDMSEVVEAVAEPVKKKTMTRKKKAAAVEPKADDVDFFGADAPAEGE